MRLWKLTCNGYGFDKAIGLGRISSAGTSLGRDSGDAESASNSNRSKTGRPKKDRYHGIAWYGSTIPLRVHGKVLHGTAGYGSTIHSRDHDAVGGAGGDAVWRRRPKTSV